MNTFNPTVGFVSISSDGHVSLLEKLIKLLGGSMETPTAYGWFHLIGILLIVVACVLAFLFARNASEKTVNWILGITAGTMVILEIYKQLTFSYDPATDVWDYQWYAFPFQFCATPMYVMSIACFLKEGKLKTSLCSYLATYGLFAGLAVILYPNNIFVGTIGINIHALLHHAAMLAIGIILFVTGKVELSHKTILRALPVFAVFISIALTANILYGEFIYPITGETCNLFYISPYFPCKELPVLSSIYGQVPYLVFLAVYAFGFTLAGYLMTLIGMGFKKLYQLIAKKVKVRNKKEQKNRL